MLHFIYNLIVQPLIFIFDVFFSFSSKVVTKFTGLYGYEYFIAIICVSIAVNVLTLPLYRRADILQLIENSRQKK